MIIWDNTSFAVNWIMPEPNYIYTVMLNTTNKTNVTVPESTNSYNVTELNDDAIYNVRVAASCRATSTSNPVTVYGELIQMYTIITHLLIFLGIAIWKRKFISVKAIP